MPSFTVFKGAEDGKPRKSTTTKPDQLFGDNILVRVTASGVCGTDLHYRNQNMVLGHEGAGVVEDLGPHVKYLKRGQRVGWGFETDSCGHCMECLQGHENYCAQRALYGYANRDQGSFSTFAIWREAFLHAIPDQISDEDAAPLQCAGATVFTALRDVRPGETVGIMGIGGLGHLAIQFAAKMGCRVVVLSRSESKKPQAVELGAREFITTNRQHSQDQHREHLSRLLVTSSVQPNWESILSMMAFRSRIYPLSVSTGNLELPYFPIMAKGIRIQGSLVASRAVHREMLAFAALHRIKPVIEKFPMTEEGILEALDKLESGRVQYRAVLIPQ
ncbi:chaperonin 10-like protein [Dactylonectria estremocensis]|uniref:Chaperonin 10-like protein n=1 Tax=Dactylonectria estremocensis TaxID=1079267 RepID=A0A9P9DHQ0_9HYPO|nr:chaperonin 10-like protein [Dactylonectria estremocensis]